MWRIKKAAKGRNMTENTQKPKRKRIVLPRKKWAEIAAIWELGDATLQELSDKYGITRQGISRKMKELGIVRGSKSSQQLARVHEEVVKATGQDAKVIAQRMVDTKEDHYNHSNMLGKLAMNELALAKSEGRALATAEPNLKAIQRAMQVVKMVREEKWVVLGLDQIEHEDEDLPELVIREMTQEEVRAIRDAQNRQMENPLDIMSDLAKDMADEDALEESLE